jgi:hypothetical protein
VPAERNSTIATRDVSHRLLIMIGDLLVCHADRQDRPMDSCGLSVETDKKPETSGGTRCVNH